MTDDRPDWVRNLEAATAKLSEGLAHASRILQAQGAMGWAYRGDLGQLTHALADMPPEQLQELSAAASLLASCVDRELAGREAP